MPALSYWRYLQLQSLLNLQEGATAPEPSPDELHFIIVHQTYELWFKLILTQLRLARDHLASPLVPEDAVPFVVHHLNRVNEILKLAVDQFRVMETLPPQDFLAFRDNLFPSSGFQSFQLREMEIVLGLEEATRVTYGGTNPLDHIRTFGEKDSSDAWVWDRIKNARAETTLRAALHAWLSRTPIHGSRPGDPGDEQTIRAFMQDYFDRSAQYHRDSTERLVAGLGEETRAATTARMDAALEGLRGFLFPADPVLQRVHAGLLFIESFRDLPLLAWPRLLLDTVVEAEQQLLLFRNRHARMVERVIGRRVGTGGSSGVDYLDQTAKYRIFPELWQVRSTLLPRERLPEVQGMEGYGFAR